VVLWLTGMNVEIEAAVRDMRLLAVAMERHPWYLGILAERCHARYLAVRQARVSKRLR